MLQILRSKLLTKTLKVLYKSHSSTSSSQDTLTYHSPNTATFSRVHLQSKPSESTHSKSSSLSSYSVTRNVDKGSYATSKVSQRANISLAQDRTETDESSVSSDELLQARTFRTPTSLDSVFLGSLSQASHRQTRGVARSMLPKPKMKKVNNCMYSECYYCVYKLRAPRTLQVSFQIFN